MKRRQEAAEEAERQRLQAESGKTIEIHISNRHILCYISFCF